MARRQHGVVARWQLLRLGVPVSQIDSWVRRGRLRPVFRAVYLVGPLISPHAHEMAAVLAYAPDAALSHHSAAYLYEILPYPAQPGSIDVTVTADRKGRHPGINLHRTATLHPHELRERHDIPVTAPVRTLIDLAGCCEPLELEPQSRKHSRCG